MAVVATIALGAFLTLTTPVAAQWFVDVYAGASDTQNGDLDTTVSGEKFPTADQEYKKSLLVGGRAGLWAGFLGVNVDVNYFRPEFDPDQFSGSVIDPMSGLTSLDVETDMRTVGIGVNVMLRGQFIKDNDVPQGRLEPYVFAGPTLFISTFDVKGSLITPLITATFDESDTSTKPGVTAGGGVTYLFTKNIGLFGEYRFTHFKPEFEFFEGNVKIEPTLDTHHFLGGVTFRF